MSSLVTNFVFGEKFTQVTNEWRDRTGRQLKELAIDGMMPKDISRYRSGVTVPSKKRLLKLCEFMEVSPSVFGYDEKRDLSFDDQALERYKEDEAYIRRFIAKQKPQAEEMGLSEDFLRWLKQLECTKKMFPLYRDHLKTGDWLKGEYYKRRELESSIDVDSPYQVEVEGKTYILRIADYAFISEMQKYLEECAEFFMYKRNKTMREEDEEVDRRSKVKMEGGGTAFHPLTPQELQEIDPYWSLMHKVEKRSK